MKKIIFSIFFLLSAIHYPLFTNLFADEDIPILTYYPAPYGAYKNIVLTENLTLPATTTATSGIIYAGTNTFIHQYGTENFFAGKSAGNLSPSMTGSYNTGIGTSSLNSNTTGNYNTAIGFNTLKANTIGHHNTGVGAEALPSNTIGYNNTGIGSEALYNNVGGCYNTGVGYEALYTNTNGVYNTGVGYSALRYNSIGNGNTALGFLACGYNNNNTNFSYNSAVGISALSEITTGSFNSALGINAGQHNQAGSRNVFIGRSAGLFEQGSDKLYIANFSIQPLIYGDFVNMRVGINLISSYYNTPPPSPQYTLDVNGDFRAIGKLYATLGTGTGSYVDYNTATKELIYETSSIRFKENIKPFTDNYYKILDLTPKSFNFKETSQKSFGYIAEDLDELGLKSLLFYNQDGQPESILYQLFPIYIIEVVKDQQKQIKSLENSIKELRRQNEEIKKRLKSLRL